MKTEMIHTRVAQDLKQKAEFIFSHLGVNTSDAIRIFLTQVTLNNGFPFELKIPNKETKKAIEESRKNKQLRSYSAQEFRDLLNAP